MNRVVVNIADVTAVTSIGKSKLCKASGVVVVAPLENMVWRLFPFGQIDSVAITLAWGNGRVKITYLFF
ncbi:MAG: hypothetical protein GY943_25940 [Chloroflexi bacterium]|nr:hypothetical protein [Chloroflexota bacterium]